jgi:hypothetical protein
MNQQPKINMTNQVSQLDPKMIVEHGESPTSVILAIAILLSVILSSFTWLIYVILATKPSR